MRLLPSLAGFALALSLGAQPDNNIVHCNNQNWLWVSTTKHATTNQPYLPATITPLAFTATATTGVPAGTHSWRWIPAQRNSRKETRQVTGYQISVSPSAATASFPGTYYAWECKLHKTVARTGGGQDPDFASPALHTLAQGTLSLTTFGRYTASRTLAAPVALTFDEVAMSIKWQGGEHQNTPGSQSNWGSALESFYNPMTWGFADPANVITLGTAVNTYPRFTYMEDQSSIVMQSDWGMSRNTTLNPSPLGYGLGTLQSDLASVAGQMGWDVSGGNSMAGKTGVLLFNVGPVFPIGVPFLGVTLEVNPANPFLGLLAGAGYLPTLNATGEGDGALLPIPALGPGASGTTIGAEYLLLDTTSGFVDSTQATWMRIN
jgi:hypothetical protein